MRLCNDNPFFHCYFQPHSLRFLCILDCTLNCFAASNAAQEFRIKCHITTFIRIFNKIKMIRQFHIIIHRHNEALRFLPLLKPYCKLELSFNILYN